MPALREALRPCPFCGSRENEADRTCLRVTPDPQRYFAVSCWCGASGPVKDSEEEAIKSWNNRNLSDRQLVWNPFGSSMNRVSLDFKGNLKSIPLPTILQMLVSDNKTGILQFTQGEKRRAICLKDGKIVAGSGQPGLQLGQILFKKGLISPPELLQVLDKAKQAGMRIGEMLLKMGYISQDNLKELIRQQIREVVFDLLCWAEGDFQYQDCSVEFNDQLIDDVNAFQLLLESSARKDELLVAG
ncbi:MAG: Lar family restriction alleviation protein [Deltaproteobacteria bacterium]|nr:MAG: Lar family restriction alleviation protein [Deltaproteobacteria bacterium]